MSRKFVFLVLALALSCFAQNNDNDIEDCLAHVDAQLRISFDDLIKSIKDLISKPQQALNKLKNILPNIEEKIKDITGSIDVSGILGEILQQIEAIIKAAGVDRNAAASCLEAEKKAAEKLGSTIGNNVIECTKVFDSIRGQLQQQITDITSASNQIVADINKKMKKCTSSWKPWEIVKCLEGLLETSTEKVNSILQKNNQLIDDTEKLVNEKTAKLTTCVEAVAKDANDKKTIIINDFQKCIDDIVNKKEL